LSDLRTVAIPDFSPILPDGIFKCRIPIDVLVAFGLSSQFESLKMGLKMMVIMFLGPLANLF